MKNIKTTSKNYIQRISFITKINLKSKINFIMLDFDKTVAFDTLVDFDLLL